MRNLTFVSTDFFLYDGNYFGFLTTLLSYGKEKSLRNVKNLKNFVKNIPLRTTI